MLHTIAAIVAQDNGKNIMEVSDVFDKSEIGIIRLNTSKWNLTCKFTLNHKLLYPWPAVKYAHRCPIVNLNRESQWVKPNPLH